MKKILITGGDGQLGNALKLASRDFKRLKLTFTDIAEFDITSATSVEKFLSENNYDYLINCAAYTAVDKAEDDRRIAFLINEEGPKNLAVGCKKNNCILIHISTDYVFDGKSHIPYTEKMEANPPSVYGQSKLAGEKAILNNSSTSIILRTSWLYSEFGANFMKTMLKLGKEREQLNVIFDQIGTPTYAVDLAGTILTIVDIDKKFDQNQIFHYSNEGVISWYDFAKEILELANLNCKINPIESWQYPLPAPRPHYSVLNKAKIKSEFDIKIPYWKESLKVCMSRL